MQKKCVIYCRVSTIKQAQDGESLEAQEKICRKIASGRNLKIVPDGKVFRESFSGKMNHRPILDKLLAYIKKHPNEVDYFVFRVIDRFTRGGSLSYETIKAELAKYNVELIDSYGVIRPSINTLEHLGVEFSWSKYSPSEITEIVLANSGKAEVTNILTRMIGSEISLTRDGYKSGPPDDGYLNKKTRINNKKKTVQIPDPERSLYYIEIFNLRASNLYTDEEIVAKLNAMGFKTRIRNIWNTTKEETIGTKGGKPLCVKQLQRIIKRSIYCGVIMHKWTSNLPVRARYDGLVSIDKFNKANRGKIFLKENIDNSITALYDYESTKKEEKRSKNNPLFPCKNIILCPLCKKPFLGSSPKGKSGKKFPTYHCARNHKYFGVSKKELEDQVQSVIKNIEFTKMFNLIIEKYLIKSYEKRKEEFNDFSSNIDHHVSKLKIKKKQIIDNIIKVNSEVVIKELEKEAEKVEEEILESEKQKDRVGINKRDIKDFTNNSIYLMEHREEMLLNSTNVQKQQALFRLVFKEFPTYHDIVNGTPSFYPMFELSSNVEMQKSPIVPPRGVEPLLLG